MHRCLTRICLALSLFSLTACFFDNENPDLASLKAYDKSSPYADVLARCVQASGAAESCRLSTLPTIGMETPSPTIEDIMERVVVSDEWMGERFETLLGVLPDDILYLTQAVTAVVIGADIRPSYYWNMTGAIYLDPGRMWLKEEERRVISTDPDHRDAYSNPMAFRSFWRWTKGDQSAWPVAGTSDNGIRPLSDIIYPMASLLFHELAHANDLFPLSAYANVSLNDSIYSASTKLRPVYPSTTLKNNQPLQSESMFHFASILFSGVKPSEEDTKATASEIGSFFESDIASDDYAYTSQYEDVAMLFEEAMMKLHFGIDRDMAFITPLADGEPQTGCNDNIVGWGIRNRLGDPSVIPRAKYVVATLLAERNYGEQLDNFPTPVNLATNVGWCASREIQPNFEKSFRAPATNPPMRSEYYTRPYRLMR